VWVAGNAKTASSGSFFATVQLRTAAANFSGVCAYASNYPPVGKIEANVIRFTGTAPYTVVLENMAGEAATYTAYSPFPVSDNYTMKSFTDKTGAPGIITASYQPQGSCTYTEPAVVGTFATFPPGYSAATYVSLIDARDNKAYPVVKISSGTYSRWIMARNLNYQKDLKWQANSNRPTTASGGGITALIGHFWCPGGVNGNIATSSSSYSCEVWGALYSWETAMMVDGKWSDDNRNSSAWAEPAWSSKGDSGNTNNGGRGANGHGICPPNWHVPTDGEWGELLNAMESTSALLTHNTGTGYRGANAGARGKSKCMCAPASGGCATDENVSWQHYNNESARGTDFYGSRVLPSGYRNVNGSNFDYRGDYAYFWSSSANSDVSAWCRTFYYDQASVSRSFYTPRSYGFSVRCIRNN
jgi:uncharacterized protein (TIGR02145 family)